MTTAIYMTLDPEREELQVVSAGHPPPLVIAPDGSASFLPVDDRHRRSASRAARGLTSSRSPSRPGRP